MRQETINIYKFDELSDAAKEKAREWYRNASDGDTSDFDCTIEDAVRMGEMLGIEFKEHAVKLYGGGTRREANIYWSGFCSQGDGASFEGTYRYRIGAKCDVKTEAPEDKELHRIARELQQAQASHFYGLSTTITQFGHYSHSNTMNFMHSYSSGYYECDATEQIEQALKDFADWIYDQLDSENDYQNSDDNIKCNDYEFYENGERA